MSNMQDKRKIQAKAARLQIVSRLWLRQYSYRDIRKEVMKELSLTTYSTSTVKRDVASARELLNERVCDNMEEGLLLELQRTDNICKELYEQWELSKRNNGLGNVAYIAEIRQHLVERRKLLGLYAPEKKEVSGGISFASLLMESNVVEEDEQKT